MNKLPKLPTLFFCKKCNMFFYSYSKLKTPTHTGCMQHNTRLATKEEKKGVN